MQEVINFIRTNNVYFLIGLIGLSLILSIYCLVLSARVKRLIRRRNARFEEGRVEDILDYLHEQSEKMSGIEQRMEGIGARQSTIESELAGCLRNAGIVRFNAFEDVGGEQSFALALLDSNKNGVVMSNLYGRHESRVYAKVIQKGAGERALSDEEQRALEMALSR